MSSKRPEILEAENKRLASLYNDMVKKTNEMGAALQQAVAENGGLRQLTNELANALAYVLTMNAGGSVKVSGQTLRSLQGNENYKLYIDQDTQGNRIYEVTPARKLRLALEGGEGPTQGNASGIIRATSMPQESRGHIQLVKR